MRVGKYQLLSKFATGGQGGGMGEIWLAHLEGPHHIRDTVILKRLLVDVPVFRDSFITEARLGMRLKHPHIARTFDAFEFQEQLWIAQDYIEGANGDELRKTTQAGGKFAGRLTADMVTLIGAHAAKALGFAHNMPFDGQWACIVHRDVTPDNLIVSCTGHTFVIDFGVAKATIPGRIATERKVLKGKISYFAPELIDGFEADARADVYGIGITLTELLTGKAAFPAVNTTDTQLMLKIGLGEIEPLQSINPSIPDDLARFVERMRHRDRDQRVQTAREVYEGLMRILKERGADIPELERQLGELATEVSAHRRRLSSPFVPLLPPRQEAAPAMPISDQETRKEVVDGGRTFAPFKNRSIIVQPAKLIPAPSAKVEINLPELSASKLEVYPPRTSLGHRRRTERLPEDIARGALGDAAQIRRRRVRQRVTIAVVAAGLAAAAATAHFAASAKKSESAVGNKETQKSLKAETRPVAPPNGALASRPPSPTLVLASATLAPPSSAEVEERPLAPAVKATHHHRRKAEPSTAELLSVIGPDSVPSDGVISVPASGRESLFVAVDGVFIGKAPQQYSVSPGKHLVVVSAKENGALVAKSSRTVQVAAGGREVVAVP